MVFSGYSGFPPHQNRRMPACGPPGCIKWKDACANETTIKKKEIFTKGWFISISRKMRCFLCCSRKVLNSHCHLLLSPTHRVLSHSSLLPKHLCGCIELDRVLDGKRRHWQQNGAGDHHNSDHHVPSWFSDGNLPKVSYPKALDWYLLVSFSFVFCSLIECLIVFLFARSAADTQEDKAVVKVLIPFFFSVWLKRIGTCASELKTN